MTDLAGPDRREADLVERASALIEEARTAVAVHANATLTMRNWHLGKMIDAEVLRDGRAAYAEEIVVTLSPLLTSRYGRGFEKSSLHRMIKFAQVFPDGDVVAVLAQQLSWSHFHALLPVWSDEARQFYIDQVINAGLSVRALRELIGRQGYERKEIANAQTPGGPAIPRDTFRDPVFLDFLGLTENHAERDLEDAILRELQAFLLEVGNGWTFVARQKRMPVGNDDFYLDLLFFARPLRRLVAVELKLGKFKPAYEGQMKLYLKWLDRYDRQPGEEFSIGLILCTEADRGQVELLEMHKDGIAVAEYWTTLPPKAELESRIRAIYAAARERVARREIEAAADEDREG